MHTITIELSTPTELRFISRHQPHRSIGSQSIWLLLKLWQNAQAGDGAGWLREAELRDRYPHAQNLRMLISRAFADFTRWQVRVGWGKDRSVPVDLLALSGRNRGPFWLAAGEANKIAVQLHGRAASLSELAIYLRESLSSPERSMAVANTSTSPTYWRAWSHARSEMLGGRLIVDAEHGALALYRFAHQATSDPWLQALALLQQAMVWRRAGNADAAMKTLAKLDRRWHDLQAPEHAWLGAMAALVRAWCAYAARDVLLAKKTLQETARDPRWAGLFLYHPRVRFEYANLQALIHRNDALNESHDLLARKQSAAQSLHQYQQALRLASEAEIFDSAVSAASNLGWSLWLFQSVGLELDPTRLPDGNALSWVFLALQMADRFQAHGGCWSEIYLLRMVRNAGPRTTPSSPQSFRAHPVLTPKAAIERAGQELSVTIGPNWLSFVRALQDEIDQQKLQVDPLQRANVLLELAWYESYQGDIAKARVAITRLKARLREIAVGDRRFFRDAIRCIPQQADRKRK